MKNVKEYIKINWKQILIVSLISIVFGFLIRGKRIEEVERVVKVPVVERVEVEVVKEVEKIVYKDSPETLEALELYKDSSSVLAEGYITMFDVAEACMDMYELPIHQDYYDILELAKAAL